MKFQHDANPSVQRTSEAQTIAISIALDDFGLSKGVNMAACVLAEKRRIKAIGCMVGAPKWLESAHLIQSSRFNQIDIGLHLDFTQYPLFVPKQSLSKIIYSAYTGKLDPALIRNEVVAQLNKFEDDLQRQPGYLDGHQHIHQLPIIRDVLLDELARRYSVNSFWVRSTKMGCKLSAKELLDFDTAIKPKVIEGLGSSSFVSAAEKLTIRHNHRLLGVYNFQETRLRYPMLMDMWLQNAMAGDLLMCHPSTGDGDEPADDPIHYARAAEFEYLMSDEFEQQLRLHRCELLPMSKLLV